MTTCLAGGCVLSASSSGGSSDAGERPPADAKIEAVADAGADAIPAMDPTACDDLLADTIFCDGFEGALGDGWSGMSIAAGTLEHSTEIVYRGDGALRATTSAPGQSAALVATFEAIAEGTVYGRAYFYVPDGLTWTFAEFLTLGPAAGNHIHFALDSDEAALVTGDDSRFLAGTPVPTGRWLCVQLAVTIDGVAGTSELSLDAEAVASASDLNTAPEGGYGELSAGIVHTADTQVEAEIYLDEVAFAAAPIPCDP